MSRISPPNLTTNAPSSQLMAVASTVPTPRLNLNDLDGVRREMARVYKDMRGGSIPSQDGARLVYVLGELRKMFEACELEKRIEALEG